ncbi:MAG TPA: hypothetical protein VGN06_01205, partial [Gaiellaceae bacterium]
VYESDRALHVSVQPGHSLTVFGYLGEPLLRVGDTGPAIAANSPTAEATKLVVHGRSAVWHDVRTSRRLWGIPMAVDGLPTVVAGTTTKLAHPALWPWLLAVALILLAALRISSSALGIASAAAAVVVAAAFMLSAYADPGTWIAGVDEIFFIAAGVGALRLGPPAARIPSAAWLGLVGLAVGLSKGQVFLHALVLSALPGTVVRLGATIAIGAGLAGAVTGCLAYVRSEA